VSVATRNRAAMPTVARFVDELRALFPDCRVLYAKENGQEIVTEEWLEEQRAIREGRIYVVSAADMVLEPRGDEDESGS
jgi:hypothetical protein